MIAEIFILIMSIFLIAVSAIGIECYNNNPDWETSKLRRTNKNFMIVMIVVGILGLFASVFFISSSSRKSALENAKRAIN